jgi:hypothetical protein
MDGKAFDSAHNAFHMNAPRFSAGTAQAVGAGLDLAAYRERVNARRIDSMLREHQDGTRTDGFSANAGFHLARQLEFVHTQVLEEQFPVPNGLRLFKTDESVPVGARTHTMRRVYQHGEARFYRGPGDRIPRVGATQREETWPIRHLLAGYAWDIFEAASTQFANSGLMTTLARGARDAIMERANRAIWEGAEEHGLYGVLNYPFLPKKVIAQGFSAVSVAADPDLVLAELHALVNFPHQNSKSVFQPNVLVLTNHVHDVLSTTRIGTTSDTTILEQFRKNSAHITRIEVAWELEDAGGASIHGIFAYRDDQRGVMVVMPQGITQLPIQTHGLESEVINYMSFGGVVMPDVLNNILGLVDITA